MTLQEAIKEAETQIDVYENMILYNKDFEPQNDNSNYERKIEFLKMTIEALEKQNKKKPIKKTGAECGMYYKKWNYYCCPTCGEPVEVDDDELYSTIYYPTCECGQKIKYDWERDEE